MIAFRRSVVYRDLASAPLLPGLGYATRSEDPTHLTWVYLVEV